VPAALKCACRTWPARPGISAGLHVLMDIQCPTAACITTCRALSEGLNGALPRPPGHPTHRAAPVAHRSSTLGTPISTTPARRWECPNPSSDQPRATLTTGPQCHTHLFLARGCLHTCDLSLHGLPCRSPWLVQFDDCLYSDVEPSAGTKRRAIAPSAGQSRGALGETFCDSAEAMDGQVR
jgi:hypothetical protein